ncbi:MAG: hypothetical protein J7L96_05695 [Bacteroidales bacterium]|nr:hypothetical protein [Bacteroidales bacterium]
MLPQEKKQKLFIEFLHQWGDKFKQAQSILEYIDTYPDLIIKLNFNLMDTKELKDYQFIWISLLAQFDNPIETEFFKPYWIPLQDDGYDFFMDLSSEDFPIFEAMFFFNEPYRWYKKYLFKNTSEFLASMDDSSIDLDLQLAENEEAAWIEFEAFFKERDKLGYEGKIKLNPLERDDLFIDQEEESSYKLSGDTLVISSINSIAAGLLPYDTNIILHGIKIPNKKDDTLTYKIQNVKAFVYLLQNNGFLQIHSYHFSFALGQNEYVEYRDNTLTVCHLDKSLLQGIIRLYEQFKDT